MKKRILVIGTILSLAMVTASPLSVSAETTVISGTIANTAVLTAPSNITFTNFVVGTNTGSSTTPGSVVANASGWSLEVTDAKVESKGYMTRADGNNLSALIQVGMTSGSVTTISLYQAQLVADTAHGYGAAGTFTIPLYVSQLVGTGDLPGAYSITLTYTATPAS
ncbi:hypothetical protein Dform_01120 [Dehalogenimonas formicexedens]|uniref:Uncharacterized protein n=1 Tax=Dehalogenimonas formicexedens TaxID=1839801 RepID=A0A1P8F7K6_9CHLR|nr:hypothetical protein [Dehalogenimonas formicexedens]APV44454.1 hypothetical protein Dform_01120 [Dehalogenimonas formicexedens]